LNKPEIKTIMFKELFQTESVTYDCEHCDSFNHTIVECLILPEKLKYLFIRINTTLIKHGVTKRFEAPISDLDQEIFTIPPNTCNRFKLNLIICFNYGIYEKANSVGHYYCYTKTKGGNWLKISDSVMSEQNKLGNLTNTFLLLFERL
jgi:hypothetical protein